MNIATICAAWRDAIAHAELATAGCRRYDFSADQKSGQVGAVWFRPGEALSASAHFPDAGLLSDANDPEHIELHRVGIWACEDVPLIGARLRHELEHAVQWNKHGRPLFDLYDLIRDEILSRKIGGLDGCAGVYINAIPSEQDANAAAARFLRDCHPDDVPRICADKDNHLLACSLVGPEPLDALPWRMIAYMSLHPRICAQVEQSKGRPLSTLLDDVLGGAGNYWDRLVETW